MLPRLVIALAAALTALAPASAHAAVVGATGSTTTVRPADASTPTAASINVSATRNEFASLQIAVRADAGALGSVTVAKGTAFTKGADQIPAGNVSIYREDYYTVATPSDGEAGAANPCAANCRWPDALIPSVDPIYGQARNAWPVNVPAGENRVAWIDVLVPQAQAAGTYTGTFTVHAGATLLQTITVNLKVVDFSMTSTSSLQGTFALDWHNVCRSWGGNGNDCSQVPVAGGIWKMYSDIVRLGLDNRISISGPSYGAPTAGNMANFNTYALPYIKGTGATKLAGARLATVLLNRWEDWAIDEWRLKGIAEGFEDRITFYCDEVAQNANTWNEICNTPFATAQANWNAAGADTPLPSAIIGTRQDMNFARGQNYPIAAQNGGLQTMIPLVTRLHTGPECCAAPNWWGAYPGQTFWGNQRSLYDSFLAERPGYNRLWMYTSCMTEGCGTAYDGHVRYSGWPSYAIDQAEGESRSLAWQVFNYKATGEYYYESAKRMDTAFDAGGQYEDGGNGDGTLFYPGKVSRIGGQTDTVLESMRLKRIREGREDYELLSYLASHGQEAQARQIAGGPYGAAGGLFDANAMYDSAHGQSEWDAARTQLETLVSGQAPEPDLVTCNGKVVTITAAAGVVTNGTAGDDVIVGTAGEDEIRAGAGNDTICGGAGYDTIRPGIGADWVDGEGGEDAIDYSQETHGVTVNLETGVGDMTDSIRGFNEVFGSVYDDTLIGDSAYNFLAGNIGADRIEGAGGPDLIWGREGADTIIPGSGQDRVLADDGADTILARDGEVDTIGCGADVDGGEIDVIDTVAVDCEALAPPAVDPAPVDVCPNMAGAQPTVPDGMRLENGQCVAIPAPDPVDVCPNMAGAQPTVPDGMRLENGQCVAIPVVTPDPIDVCANIAGIQSRVPGGMYAQGDQCRAITKPALGLRQYTAQGRPRACGTSPARACVQSAREQLRLRLAVKSASNLRAQPVRFTLYRKVGTAWRKYRTATVRLDSAMSAKLTTRLARGQWRMNVSIAATVQTYSATSSFQYLRVR